MKNKQGRAGHFVSNVMLNIIYSGSSLIKYPLSGEKDPVLPTTPHQLQNLKWSPETIRLQTGLWGLEEVLLIELFIFKPPF